MIAIATQSRVRFAVAPWACAWSWECAIPSSVGADAATTP